MPQKGDTVYRYWNGKLETAIFIEESIDIAAGATAPTWLVRCGNKQIRVSPDYYNASLRATYEDYLCELRTGVEDYNTMIAEFIQGRDDANTEIAHVEALIASLADSHDNN